MKTKKRLFLLLSTLISIQLACSMGGLLASEDSSQGVVNQPDSEQVPSLAPAELLELTPMPTPRMNGALLFSDDCSGDGRAQAIFGAEYMAFSYQDGLCQITANSNTNVLPVMYSAPILTNFIAEYELSALSPKPESEHGIIFRSDDVLGGLAHYYYIALKPVDKSVEFSVWNNQWILEKELSISPSLFPTENPMLVRLEVLNNEFRIFLNGIFVFEFLDDQISTPGILGISIASSEAPEKSHYDNLKIYEIVP